MQGDVTKIIDGSGNVVVQYAYDSWGKVLSVTGSLASTVGAKNPIRYRGYYYDAESELYYLNSRYYDPETGRFISPDAVAEGGNLYTYCANDPVNRSDDSGYLSAKWKQRLMKIAAGIVFAVGAVAVTVATGGAALPVIAGIVGGAALSGAIGGTIALIQGNDGKEAIIDGLVDGFMWSGFFSAVSSMVSAVKSARSFTDISKPTNTVATNSEKALNAKDVKLTIKNHGTKYMEKRGWDLNKLQKALDGGKKGWAINRINNNPCSVYFSKNGSYVVIDDITNEVVQFSQYGDKHWIIDQGIHLFK